VPWEPLPDANVDPAPIGQSLDRLMTRLSGVSVSAIEVIMDNWVGIVGEVAAAASAPVKLGDGVLTVRTDDAVFASELRWLEATIIEQVAARADGAVVREVKVVVRDR
jgi:predicted nucleic acid-binding Zn ribbon protein